MPMAFTSSISLDKHNYFSHMLNSQNMLGVQEKLCHWSTCQWKKLENIKYITNFIKKMFYINITINVISVII